MKLISRLLDLLYPPRCVFCRRLLYSGEDPVCRFCKDSLPYTGDSARRNSPKHTDGCYAPLYYEGTVRESLHRFKFSQRTGYADIYAGFMVKCIDENEIFCDIISWAPVSRKRKRSRGYDQSELIARAVASRTGLPCERTLDKIRDTSPQSLTKNARQRAENVKGAYRCCASELVQGKKILLIDDIVTSGSTLSECAKMLKEAGASDVIALTAACVRS